MKRFIETASFLQIDSHIRHGGWRMARHSHDCHEFIIVHRGGQETAIGGRKLRAAEGDLLLYPARVLHEERQMRRGVLETDSIGFFCKTWPDTLPLLQADLRGRIRVMAQWLRSDRHREAAAAERRNPALLRAMLSEYVELAAGEVGDELAARLRSYVESRIADPLTLDDLSHHFKLSRYHLVRKYRAVTGQTPMAAVARLRLERARDIVLSTSLPLKDIPAMIGLNDVYHMTRLFRRHMGVTPGSLRRRKA